MSTSILNGNQSREYTRAQAMQLFFDDNSKIYTLSPPFNQEAQLFFSNNKQLQAYIPIKNDKGTGITKDKAVIKSDVAEAAAFVCAMTTAYAIKTGNNDLKAQVDYTQSDIEKMKDPDILGFVTSLVTTISPLLVKDDFAGYSITTDTLTALAEQAGVFNGSIGKAGIVDTKSSIASRNINAVLKNIRGNITQFDLLIAFFKKKDPDFVKGYRAAAAINHSGIHHSGIKGIVIKSTTEQPLDKVSVTLTGKKKSKNTATDEDGAWQIATFRPGKCKLTFSASGCISQTVEVTIIRGKTLEFNITLQTQAINIATA